jgi:hypothetical protein
MATANQADGADARDDMIDEHPGTEELAARLNAYASVRLALPRGSAARIRSAVVEEARMRSLERQLGGARMSRNRRRGLTLVLAAALTLVVGIGVAAASGAGGPLYGVRIWLETATLPADASARIVERIHQIDARVLEVERAAAAGDQNAVASATGAYEDAVSGAVADSGLGADQLDHLQAALALHLGVLQDLSTRVPPQALPAIDRAIESSQKAVSHIKKAEADQNADPGAGPGTGPTVTAEPTPSDGNHGHGQGGNGQGGDKQGGHGASDGPGPSADPTAN